jgi:pimeloyl-ACP methyl ester carboxylesterase
MRSKDFTAPLTIHAVPTRVLQIAGYRTFLREAGVGPPLLLLPSMLVLSRSYRPIIRELANSFHVLCPEFPGIGHGQTIEQPWSFEEYADFLVSFLDSMNLDRASIIGHSNSGPLAIIFAAEHPQRVSQLILADSIGADQLFSLPRVFVGRAIDAALEFTLSIAGFHHILYNLFAHPRNFFNQVGLSAETDIIAPARRVTSPTLIAWGARDNTMPLRCGVLLHQTIAGSDVKISPTGSHDWLITNPVEFAAALCEWSAHKTEAPHVHAGLRTP